MTTTNDAGKGAARARRRRAVRLTMVAGSAMVLAVSWAGVARADRDQGSATAPAAVMVDMAVDVVGAAPEASPASDGTLVPAPPVTRQVIVVRRSRAS